MDRTASRRPRASSQAIADLRIVRDVVRPYQARLEVWHERVASLRAIPATGRGQDELITVEAARLAPVVAAARIELARDAAAAGDKVAEHSVFRDLDRALLRLAEAIDQLILPRQPAPGSGRRDSLAPG